MATVLKTKFQLRRGNAEVWARNNPVLERGEPGFEIDTGRLKIGNGQTAWNDLEYLAPQSGAGGGVQPDWNQNDETAADYVKNRPFYTGDPVETVLVEESTVSFMAFGDLYSARFSSTFEATVGETYKVSWDGTVYECTCIDSDGRTVIGNLSVSGTGSDTGEPFFMDVTDGIAIFTADTSASHTISISHYFAGEVVKIDPKYIRDMYYTGDPVETVLVEESTVSFAENHGIHMAQLPSTFDATVGETYKVSWDGTVYECTCVSFRDMSVIGNLSIAGAGSDTGEPFVIGIADGEGIQIVTTDTSASHTFSISGTFIEIKKIDTKYIPVQVKNIPNAPDDWTDKQKAQYLSDFQNGTVLILGDTTAASVITFLRYSKNLGLQVTYIEENNIKYYNSSSGYGHYDMQLIEDRATNGYYTATNAQTTATNAQSMCDVIKYTITEIPDYAFKSNTELESIDLPNLTSIGEYAFSGCSKLALTSLPSGLTSIGVNAFQGCANLALTSLPSGITSIGTSAFSGCIKLALTSLPSGITSIGVSAFQSCEKLALTSLPSGITSIGNYAFYQCTNLALTSLPSGITSIGSYAFFQCTNLALTSLPSSITRIGTSTFANCTNLALTSLPSGLTSIDNYAFVRCTKLALTSLPSGITSIGVNAFYQCTGLTSITFTGTPTSIDSNAFSGCTNLTTINVPWAEGAVANAPWGATNATINYNYTGA